MLRAEAISIVRRGLGFRDDLEDDIIAALKQAQRIRESGSTMPWFLREEDATLSVLTGVQEVDLPTDFLRPDPDDRPHYTSVTSDTPIIVPFKAIEDARQAWSDTDPAGPKVVVLRKTQLQFWPIPDADYTLTWSFFKKATVLDTDIENAWLEHAPDLLIGDAGLLMAGPLSDQDAVKFFTAMMNAGLRQAFQHHILREQDAMPIEMGSDM